MAYVPPVDVPQHCWCAPALQAGPKLREQGLHGRRPRWQQKGTIYKKHFKTAFVTCQNQRKTVKIDGLPVTIKTKHSYANYVTTFSCGPKN